MTRIISTVLCSNADKSRPAKAAIANLRTDISAITYEQDSEIDMNIGSFDSNIDETLSMPTAETVMVSTLSNSFSKFRSVDARSSMPAITT